MAARTPRTVAGLVLAALALAATAALSQAKYGQASVAVLRLSWRAQGERVEECRHPTAEELARLPQHMRQSEICEGRVTPFVLRLAVNGETLATDTVHAAGAREDRPIYVFRETALEPGEYEVDLTFERLGGMATAADGPPAAEAGRQPFPASLGFRSRIHLDAGEIALITYDEDSRTLVRRESSGR
jgi:hypothetical protein